MHSLLNHPLVRWILRIQYLNRLPASLLLARIVRLHCQTRKQHTKRQTLCIHTRLHQLLRTRQVFVAVNQREGYTHGCDPGAEDDGVAVLVAPVLRALHPWLLLCNLGAKFGLAVGVLEAFRLAFGFEATGGAISGDDSCRKYQLVSHAPIVHRCLPVAGEEIGLLTSECTRRAGEESTERHGETAEGGIAALGEDNASGTDEGSHHTAEDAAGDGGTVIRSSVSRFCRLLVVARLTSSAPAPLPW